MQLIGGDSANPINQLYPGLALQELMNAAMNAVHQSFQEFPANNITREEIKRRNEIVIRWAKILRGDLKWSPARVHGHLYAALKSELQGVSWTPPKRTVWLAGEG